MSDTRFTPGPWFVDLNNPLRDDSYAVTTGEYDTGDWIASVRPLVDDDTGMVRGAEHQANARLIAAAPDLYAACAGALSVMGADGYAGIVVHSLRAALAKARGEK